MSARRLLLLRHGRTAWNSVGRAQGQADVELDDLGHQQAAEVASHLATLPPAALWTSDLARARQTCAYLERVTGLAAKTDERLREFDVGARQGMTAVDFEAAFPDAFLAWRAGEEMVGVPGSEVAEDVAARMVPALHEILSSLEAGETGVVVTHGAGLKVGLLGLLGWPQSQGAQLRGIGNCAWATVEERAGRLRLEGYNERLASAGDGMRDL
ncbi:MAG TPA: histidine phosphatase family protein [Nocardioidaceae bacterium]|nr:histidine phosphatase family protein [Nocardioidaceae bacterium]